MTEKHPDDDRPDEPTDEPSDDERTEGREGDESSIPEDDGGEGWLSSLIDALEQLDERSRARARGGGSRLDFDVSIRSLDDAASDRPRGRSTPRGPDRRSGSSADRRRTRRYDPSERRPTISTREYDDEIVVSADVAGIDERDLAVGFDGDDLVLGLDGRELERVSPPWPNATATDAVVRNGVLTVRITPDDGPERGPDG